MERKTKTITTPIETHKKLRVVLGSLFIIIQFIPLGGYHFEGDPVITGPLLGILFPHGVLAIILGFILIFNEKWRLGRFIRLNYLLILGGLVITLESIYEPRDYILGLWHGVEGDFNIEGIATGFLTGILSIFTGIIITVINSSLIINIAI